MTLDRFSMALWRCGLLLLSLVSIASGHGYVSSPRSRNFVAYKTGLDWGSKVGVPNREYCYYCLNRNNGVCGVSSTPIDYDKWLDSTGKPMPWVSQGKYTAGGIIRFKTTLTTHHYGHFEFRACNAGRSSNQTCMDAHPLKFVKDNAYKMPADPSHPERGYLAGPPRTLFDMTFQLPANYTGTKVLVQWKYITANSCNPPGYKAYFNGANNQSLVLPANYWSASMGVCNTPYPNDGSVGNNYPEQFFNCIEVSINK